MNIIRKLERICLKLKYGFSIPSFDGMMNASKCEFLYRMVNNYKGEKNLIVEIGSFKGCSTTWLAMAGVRNNFKGLIAIDLFTGTPSWKETMDTYDIFMKRMTQNNLINFVKPNRGDSKEIIKTWDHKNKISILHIDGDHSYDGIKADMDNYIPFVVEGGIIIIDDYDSFHPDVMKATDELIKSNKFNILTQVKEIPKKGFGSIAITNKSNT